VEVRVLFWAPDTATPFFILPHSRHPLFMQTISFKLSREHIALCDLLKLTGIADSGGRGKSMVADGLVILNGETEYRKTAKIRAGDTVRCEETEIIVEAAI